ncbi:raffinose/stachyose/melibiose transport system permease protein [Arthrobacter sp. V4I6]|uniref:carbohydrate ABC transporter permease n=1 Tax=unclassified Arthrobacter TaxID=235627 RepID=UPI002786BA3D|nr:MULTISPECIES: carbohydrate ABC transporter permease [unclassified Arthrobacter]MDQ0822268.1 raffinose/stachyose/melibiose transport system permease protein [Arthrobacter sp. V1I7]MDQ0851905.1 raffinose/stachyose/melibiose transport system permease protein [Arthrobacter sp. V4I6]
MTASTFTGSTLPAVDAPVGKIRRSSREGFKVNWWLTALMLVASLTVLLPLYFTVAMALKTPDQIGTGTGLAWPNPMNWENFAAAYVATNFPRAFMSTAFVTVFSVLGALACSSLVAYAIARNWHHKFFRGSFVYLLSAMFIPFPVIILPLIKQTALLGLDNPAGVVFLHVLGGISFNALLYIAFVRSIPVELEESARMDGATTWQVFRQIIFPLLAPMNATVGIFAFLGSWNDFLLPQMMIADPALQTLPVVQMLFQGEFNTNYSLAFASYLMALAPTLVVYILAQRWVLSGVMRGAVK